MSPAPRLDRLSALVSRFALGVTPETENGANLAIYAEPSTGEPALVVFVPGGKVCIDRTNTSPALFLARVEWGGSKNPLFTALPARIEISVNKDFAMISLVSLLVSESLEPRCGSNTVLNRLGEVLLVRILRGLLEAGTTSVGLLAGLADSRLSHAIVAMHEDPGHRWSNERLANIAGLSLSRFADQFGLIVGETPMSYLRRWRMTLARYDIEKGDRIHAVANRYGYGSSEALARAFRRQFTRCPTALRQTTQ